MRRILIIAAIIGCVLGYGYGHSSTHAAFFVQLGLMDVTTGKPQNIPGAEVVFLDSEGRVLANGISDENHNYVHLIHPEVGDCHEIEESASFRQRPGMLGRSVLSICQFGFRNGLVK